MLTFPLVFLSSSLPFCSLWYHIVIFTHTLFSSTSWCHSSFFVCYFNFNLFFLSYCPHYLLSFSPAFLQSQVQGCHNHWRGFWHMGHSTRAWFGPGVWWCCKTKSRKRSERGAAGDFAFAEAACKTQRPKSQSQPRQLTKQLLCPVHAERLSVQKVSRQWFKSPLNIQNTGIKQNIFFS